MILTMLGGTNRRGVAAPLDMVIFESDEYALPGWDMLSAHKDRLWTLKQCKKYITASHIVRLWYCDDMDAIQGGSLGISYDSMYYSTVTMQR
jgi:hypothetical protein